ncbi:MAG: hypothetical protein HND58_10750 [Planctomycetota bacterium]|nr:MAG: hypothetical protein HND58_10750 [Planctomycetota bacterium]
MSSPDHVDVEAVLQSLKSFQRRSVDYVFDRLYGDDATRRFLLADEVGLGKTHVARGVIAKSIDHLHAVGESRIDVVYICSNADIARQNISRLNVTGQKDFQLTDRITLLPGRVRHLEKNKLNFISFTPGTSFKLGHSEGQEEERRLVYWLLKSTWPRLFESTAALNIFQGGSSKDNFRRRLRADEPTKWIDARLAKQFTAHVRSKDQALRASGELSYKDRFRDLCDRFHRNRKHLPPEDRHDRRAFVGEMRALLAETCIEALEPDLIILDEFQRFKSLLDPADEAGSLARMLFEWRDARVLLLSATPYKMYTLSHESDVDDHYRDFVGTLRFLLDDEMRTERVQGLLTEYGRASARLDRDGMDPLRTVKGRLETELRRVMCRTEKLAVTEDRSGMLRDADGLGLSLRPEHVRSYLDTRRVADALGHRDIVEYWKASPFLLNFMDADHYKLKSLLREALDEQDELVDDALSESADVLLGRDAWQTYGEIDPKHAQLDHLLGDTIARGWWRRLWVPPAHPDYELEGVFSGTDPAHMTKRLIFSSWHIVPKAISVLLSYEAERLMMTTLDADAENTPRARERRRPLLMFTRSEDRLTGMPVLGVLYPSVALAELGEAAIAEAGISPSRPSLEDVLECARQRVNARLEPIVRNASSEGAEDESWYWAAPILLDRDSAIEDTEAWFEDAQELAEAWSGEEDEAKGWHDHVAHAAEVATGQWRPSGRPPKDLAQVLALLSVAGPAVCALRAFTNELGSDVRSDPLVRHAAGRASWGLRSLFNGLEVIALIRGMNSAEPYWRRVLEYCAAGCLQSVIDEYLHMLVEAEGLVDAEPAEAAAALASVIASTAGMRAATPGVDWVERDAAGHHRVENQRVRARFAMRFGDERGERDESSLRKEVVRKAFNSPFWPFVLATTSIGQEGLDFHSYCHAVVHWNLPSNPVDLEQREGRVHRYKGHAVRKNVAQVARTSGTPCGPGNPWRSLFEYARSVADEDSDISPYWVFPVEGGAVIERHVPSLPLSRESSRLPALRRSLAVYRMVFGQPRQEDLVEHMKQAVPEDQWAALSRELSICLEPQRD